MLASSAGGALAETKTFKPEGGSEQAFVVPPGVTQIEVTAIGGAGEEGCGEGLGFPLGGGAGAGAKVGAVLNVEAGKTLYVDFIGGTPLLSCKVGYKFGGVGGSASDVRSEPGESATKSLESRLVVAGGGGGGGDGSVSGSGGKGGSASGTEGEAGGPGSEEAGGGGGGTGVKGGAGGVGSFLGNPGGEGKFGFGGAASEAFCNVSRGIEECGRGGGGGGGGYWGGGGGGSTAEEPAGSGGGGGAGSSFVTSAATSHSYASGKGEPQEVVITYTPPPCTSVLGRGTFGKTGELGRFTLIDELNTSLSGRQYLHIGYIPEAGHVAYKLLKLESASCTGAEGSRVFAGSGPAEKQFPNAKPELGYELSFSFTEKAGGIYFKGELKKGATLIEPLGGPLKNSTEKIS